MLNTRKTIVSTVTIGACALFSVAGVAGCERASTTDPDVPGGGQAFVLDFATFASTVDPILTAHGCDAIACHGGGIRGTFELSPDTDKDVAFDYVQASLQVTGTSPLTSPLLVKPLAEAAGGTAHAGGVSFTSTDDADYQAIAAWIEAGEYR